MRHTITLRAFLAGAACFALWLAMLPPGEAMPPPEMRWYKGNLHTHTINSDGDSTPNDVATWYKENRYHFLVLSDHNFYTEIEGLNAIHAARERFLLIPGEEVTDSFEGKPVHINALNSIRLVGPARGDTLVNTIQRNVDAIHEAKGIPSLNHPNFGWAISSRDLLPISNLNHFEVYNGHPRVNNIGGGGFESLDEMWDVLLTAGRRMFGVATDDAHHFKQWGRDFSNPGRGWVSVRAASLNAQDIMQALAAGNFYASTGVELADVRVSQTELRVEIKPARGTRQTTLFIGAGGRVLGQSFDDVAVYRFEGNEKYVRARILASNGDIAWTQPVFPSGATGAR